MTIASEYNKAVQENKRLALRLAEAEKKIKKQDVRIKEVIEYYAPQVKAMHRRISELQDTIKEMMVNCKGSK